MFSHKEMDIEATEIGHWKPLGNDCRCKGPLRHAFDLTASSHTVEELFSFARRVTLGSSRIRFIHKSYQLRMRLRVQCTRCEWGVHLLLVDLTRALKI